MEKLCDHIDGIMQRLELAYLCSLPFHLNFLEIHVFCRKLVRFYIISSGMQQQKQQKQQQLYYGITRKLLTITVVQT